MQLTKTIFPDLAIFIEKKTVEIWLWAKNEFLWAKKIFMWEAIRKPNEHRGDADTAVPSMNSEDSDGVAACYVED